MGFVDCRRPDGADNRSAPSARTVFPVPTSGELKAAYPDAVTFAELSDPFHYWRAMDAAGKFIGAAFITTELPPDILGYVGPVPVLVGMDIAGNIKRLVVLSNKETPYYMRRVLNSRFIAWFKGRKVTEDFNQVDAVSGATVTSRAITGDVASASRTVAKRIFSIDVPPEPEAAGVVMEAIILAAALMLALAARIWYKNRKLKWISWIAAILVTGIYLAIPLSFSHISTLLEGNLPPLSNPALPVLLIWALITTVIWGPVFCGYGCPFGAMQEIAWRAPGKKWSISPRTGAGIRTFRWLVLFGLIAVVFPMGIKEAAGFEPYPYLFDHFHRLLLELDISSFAGRLNAAIWIYAIFVLAVSTRFKRFWCRMFCPTGACLSLLSLRRRLNNKLQDSDGVFIEGETFE